MASIRGPRWEVINAGIVRQLYKLPGGNIHNIDVLPAGRTRTVMADPRKGQQLAVREPRGGYGISFAGNLLEIAPVGVHEENLRETVASAHPGNLAIGLGVPYRGYVRAFEGRQPFGGCAACVGREDFRITPHGRRKGQLRAIGRPGRREIATAEMGEVDHPP